MVKILIHGATVLTLSLTDEPVIREGYVYISDGRITAVGKGEPPEELKYPELLINGRGRLVMPGLSAPLTSVTLYPLRYALRGFAWDEVRDFLTTLTRTDVYYLACAAFQEMMLRGVTSALITDIYLDSVARAARDAGIYVALAPPFGWGLDDFGVENELRLLTGRWHERVEEVRAAVLGVGDAGISLAADQAIKYGLTLYALEADEESVSRAVDKGVKKVIRVNPRSEGVKQAIYYGEGLKLWRPGSGLGLGVEPSYSMIGVIERASRLSGSHPLDALYSATVTNPSLIGHGWLGGIEVGRRANVVMLNTWEPPGWPAPRNLPSIVRAVVNGGLRVETVIVGDNVLVDAGESMTLGYEVMSKVRSRFDKDVVKYYDSFGVKSGRQTEK